MSLKSVLKFIYNHPLNSIRKTNSICRFIIWQLSNLLVKRELIHSFTENSKILIKKGLTGATGNYYCGLHEFEEMSFLLHYLRPDDVFFDIGSNVGSYTILASAQIGAFSYAFEPVPSTFKYLQANVSINKMEENTELNNCGIGSKRGTILFTAD